MQDLGVREYNCRECLHFVGDGERCDLTNGVCYNSSTPCRCYDEMEEQDERIHDRSSERHGR